MNTVGHLVTTLPAPDPEVIQLCETYLPSRARILDIGAGIGRHAIHLAQQGHNVVALESDSDYVQQARAYARAASVHDLDLMIEQGDVRRIKYPPYAFKGVLLTRVLQEMGSHDEAENVLGVARNVTDVGGYNIVTAYTGDSAEREIMSHRVILAPGRLRTHYESKGWDIVHEQHTRKPITWHQGGPLIRSYDHLVARRTHHRE